MNNITHLKVRSQHSAFGIFTFWTVRGYNPGGRGARFSAPVQTGPGAHPASYTKGTESFSGIKRPRRGVYHPPPSSAEVEGRVELNIYPPLGFLGLLYDELYLYLYLT